VDSELAAHTSIVALRSVGKTYAGGTKALERLDLDIRRGEFVSLLGPSGCGKSTALRIVAGLNAPSSGSVAWPQGQARLGFVFQEPTLMPWANIEANVALPLALAGERRPKAAAEMLRRVGLAEFARSYPRELSGGMKMRASIARALVTGPDLLLMDEPFAALDEITRFKLNDELLALWHEMRRTVVFVTHSVFESVYLSQRIVVISPRPGRVAAQIEIPAGYPRERRFRTSAEYAALCRQVSEALAAAMGEGA
jgi:NitT/TauT family transport system ATP-binding protein